MRSAALRNIGFAGTDESAAKEHRRHQLVDGRHAHGDCGALDLSIHPAFIHSRSKMRDVYSVRGRAWHPLSHESLHASSSTG